VRKLSRGIAAARDQTAAELATAFAELPDAPSASALQSIAALIGRLKYFQRFLDEVAVIEEEAIG
jgi:hypothetical protein